MQAGDLTDISMGPSLLRELTPDQQHRLSEILDRYLSELERGVPPRAEELLAEHPDLAASLRLYLGSLDALHNAAAVFGGPAREPSPDEPALDEGERRLGDFVLVREIGRGGMGIVYEARQSSLGRRVALKILPFAAVLDSRQIARFRNEAQAAGQLHHPNIVPVYAVGVERGVHYYAMQFIDGQPLDLAIEQVRTSGRGKPRSRVLGDDSQSRRASVSDDTHTIGDRSTQWRTGDPFLTRKSQHSQQYFRTVLKLGLQAAEALHHAHEYGIVHRDIKPSNLLLDGEGQLWVTDFGLARCQTRATLTRTGDVVGTMRYMSPEQALGNSALVDHRTDVYSLGATLYELLTLQPAFPGEDGPALLRQIEQDEPKSLRRLRPDTPVDIETVILKAMAKRRDDRYATAQDLAEDIRRVLDGKPTLAKAPTIADRVYKWLRRHHRIVAATAAVSLLALVGLTVGMVLLTREKVRAEQNYVRAERNLRDARDVVHQFGVRLAQRLADVPGAEQVRRELLRDTLAYYRRFIEQAKADASLQADLGLTYNKIGTISTEIGSMEDAVEAHESAASIFERLSTSDPASPEHRRHLALCRNHLGLLLSRSGDAEGARGAYENAIKLQEALIAERPDETQYRADLALSLNNLGLLHRQSGNYGQAKTSFGEAIRRQQELARGLPADPELHRNLAASYNNLGTLHGVSQPSQAVEWYDKAIACQAKAVAACPGAFEYERDLALTWNNLGAAQSRVERSTDAVRSYGRAIEIQRRLVDAAPGNKLYRQDLAISCNNLGLVHSGLGQHENAQRSFRQALAVEEPLIAQYPDDASLQSALGGIYNNLGIALEARQQWVEAAEAYRTAVIHQEAAFKRSPAVADYRLFLSKHYYNYGRSLRQLGKPDDAVRVALARRELWPDDPQRLYSVAEELAQAGKLLAEKSVNGMDSEQCATLVVDTLRQAVQAGLKPPSDLFSNEAFAGVRGDVRFLQIAGR